ncbi:unnamed protein product [Rotaria magnacalcarata]|uniref:Uncharacterized protein n=1 Tax=Rotaria magnacalcarata TaxID=392030 RepID=A0A8S2QRE4_9BILA|nr:unnamed protein product [Rotaria magnacalcarata]CAF4116490.1 unnamed protein product [Rotaria magnacalcarata]
MSRQNEYNLPPNSSSSTQKSDISRHTEHIISLRRKHPILPITTTRIMSSRGRAVSLMLSHTDCLSITVVQQTTPVTTNSTQHSQLSAESQEEKHQPSRFLPFKALFQTVGRFSWEEETFIQPSFHDRQPNAFTSSPDIRSILHLHDRIPFTKLTEPRPDNHVDNEFNLKLPNSKQMNLIEPPRADHIVNQLGSESKSSIHVNIYFQPCLTQTKLFFHSMNLSEPPLARPIENEPDIESKNTNQINLAEPPRAHRILNELGLGWKKSNQINFPEPPPARRIENELAFEWGKSNQIEPSRAHRIENEPRLESKNSNQLNLPEPPLADRIEYQLGLQSKNSNQIYLTEPPRAHRIQNELCVESKKLNQIHLAEAPCAGRFEYELGFESNHSIQINPAELRHDVHVCDQSFSELHYRNHKLANYTNGKKNSAHVHELFTSSNSA